MQIKFNLLWFIYFGFISFALPVANVEAENFQDHATIHNAARQFMLEHIDAVHGQLPEIKNGKLDSRLRLSECNRPLEAYLPKGSRDLGRITVGVKCSSPKPWSLHVAITVSIYKDVIVAAHQLPRGKLLTENDLKLVKYDLASLSHGYINELRHGLGMELKRSLATGAPLTPNMIKRPQIIKRGQRITMLAQSTGIEVRMQGKALAHGAVGERIQIFNPASKQTLEGTVTTLGEVKVDF